MTWWQRGIPVDGRIRWTVVLQTSSQGPPTGEPDVSADVHSLAMLPDDGLNLWCMYDECVLNPLSYLSTCVDEKPHVSGFGVNILT